MYVFVEIMPKTWSLCLYQVATVCFFKLDFTLLSDSQDPSYLAAAQVVSSLTNNVDKQDFLYTHVTYFTLVNPLRV